ncbi:MAG TPA: hypothetical protein VGJ90_06255 [Methylophilaceae bacterium]|jgi:hypothetical protein
MPLSKLPLDCDGHVIADWFEFHIIIQDYQTGLIRDLQRSWDKRKNTEDSTPEGKSLDESDPDESFLESMLQQFRFRMELLGEDYPFEFNDSEETLSLKAGLSEGAVLYLFCLFLSNTNNSEIFELDKFNYFLDNRTRDLFQACATWAAAAETKGCAITFGVPRPDNLGFKAKLQQTYVLMDEGVVRDEFLPAAPRHVQDGGVDVIAWGIRRDGAAGRLYILGQVASGANWRDKSIKGDIDPFHDIWFSEKPPSTPTPAMFIPFCIDEQGVSHKQRVDLLTRIYGNMYYRYLIPVLARIGLQLATANTDLTIERTQDYPEIQAWVNGLITRLRAV